MKRSEAKRKTKAVDLIGRALEVPSAAFGGDSKIELIGNTEATVDGCRCVVEYNDTKIILNIGRGNLSFHGSDLEIASLNDRIAVVRGLIARMEFAL